MFVIVEGNWEFPPSVDRIQPIPKVTGRPGYKLPLFVHLYDYLSKQLVH